MENISESQEDQFKKNKDFFLNKNDKIELLEKMSSAREELLEKICSTREELLERIYQTNERISSTKIELIRWIVGVSFLQLIAILGALLAMIKFFAK